MDTVKTSCPVDIIPRRLSFFVELSLLFRPIVILPLFLRVSGCPAGGQGCVIPVVIVN
jgi:hypothetical protein